MKVFQNEIFLILKSNQSFAKCQLSSTFAEHIVSHTHVIVLFLRNVIC